MARRTLSPAEKAEKQALLAHSDKELLGNINYLWRKLNPKAKGRISQPSQLRDCFDADQVVCVRKGITAGFRRYEVLDSPLGRTILVFAPEAIWQHGPFRWSIKTNFLWSKAGTNIPARGARGPWEPIQKRMWCTEMPTRCHVLEKFVKHFNRGLQGREDFPPLELALEGTYAPELREARLRRIANLVVEIMVPADEVETPLDYRQVSDTISRLRKSGFNQESSIVQTAFALSELDNTPLRAKELGLMVAGAVAQDPMKYMLFSMRAQEVI